MRVSFVIILALVAASCSKPNGERSYTLQGQVLSIDAPRKLLKPAEEVPNTTFIDQDGKKRSFASFRGSTVVITFIYTRCPLPTFCPMMDRNFATMQKALQSDPALKHVHLVTVSFDPETDTPRVLRKHARELKADLTRWTFLTG